MSSLSHIEQEEYKDIEALESLEDLEELKEFFIDFNAEKISKIASKVDALSEEGEVLQRLLGVEDETMHIYYECARELLDQKKKEEAANAFLFLTMLNPYVYDFWMGLGIAEQLREEHEHALKAFSMASLINLDHPAPHFFAANSYIALGKKEEAKDALKLTIEGSKKEKDFQVYYKQAKIMERSLI